MSTSRRGFLKILGISITIPFFKPKLPISKPEVDPSTVPEVEPVALARLEQSGWVVYATMYPSGESINAGDAVTIRSGLAFRGSNNDRCIGRAMNDSIYPCFVIVPNTS